MTDFSGDDMVIKSDAGASPSEEADTQRPAEKPISAFARRSSMGG